MKSLINPRILLYIAAHSRDIRTSILMSLTLIFAGGIGNILDRLLFDRHVTDFMNIGLPILRSGIFNFADLWITAGVAWLAVESFMGSRVLDHLL